ncbi:L,D-transpeptidase [Rossellomorea vietnamensis]|uniref:L,D-transpeptidase n=1 Tax=Rossellomorea aquimaris TaxID=189382 RepID=A0A5D4TQE0_9BACI|nr:L,D-transpeptidase [Rossellomorea aquimaris]TYS76286.1 L,D-transpeptidase [Rossellomorea aquimaris]
MRLLLSILIIVSPIWPLGKNPLPGDPFLIVNKQTNEIAYIQGERIRERYNAATGKTDELTPQGLFTIIVKAENPYYRKLDIPGGDADNPLGTRWMGFDTEGTDGRIYGIHGTNRPDSIGKYISNGCIRMHNAEVEALFDKVPSGTKVLIVKSGKSFEELAREYGAMR